MLKQTELSIKSTSKIELVELESKDSLFISPGILEQIFQLV